MASNEGGKQTTLDKEEETLRPSAACAAASIPSAKPKHEKQKTRRKRSAGERKNRLETQNNLDMKTLPVQVVQSSTPGNQGNEGSKMRKLDKDDETLSSVATVASIPSGGEQTKLDKDDKTLPSTTSTVASIVLGVLDSAGHQTSSFVHFEESMFNPGVLRANSTMPNPDLNNSTSNPDGVHAASPSDSDSNASTPSPGALHTGPNGTTPNPVTTVLSDVHILSDDTGSTDELLNKLKEERPDLKITSDKDWIGGSRNVKHLFSSTQRSKTVVIVFTMKSMNESLKYTTHLVINDMLEKKQLECSRLIPVRSSIDAEIPSWSPFNIANAWEDNFFTLLVEAIDSCALNDTPCQVKLKEMILGHLKKKDVKKDMLDSISKELSIDVIEVNKPADVGPNDKVFDCYIVSCNNDWEKKVTEVLLKRNENLKVICRKDLIPELSTERNSMRTMGYGGSVLDKLMEPVLGNTKKVIVGFEGKSNGFLDFIVGYILSIQCDKGDHFGKLIPVQMSTDTVIPDIAKHLQSLKAFDDNFIEHLLEAVIETSITVKVSCKDTTNSEKYEEIEKVLHEHVEEFRDHHNMLYLRIRDYFAEIGLKFKGITHGCIVLHFAAHDPRALMFLSCSHVQKDIMKALAEILLREDLREEFRRDWSMEINKEQYDAALMELETQYSDMDAGDKDTPSSSHQEPIQGGEQTSLDKDEETLPSVACAAASIPSGSDERTLDKDDGTLPSVAAVASISSGRDLTPLDNDDRTLPLVTAAASILSSGTSEWSKDERILPSMASVDSWSSGGEQTKLDNDDKTLPSTACAVASIPSGSEERKLDKDDETLPSMPAVAGISSGGEQTSLDKDEETLPSAACAAASISSGSDERTLDKDDGTLPSAAAVASISSGSDLTPLDNDDKTLPLVTAAASILSSGSEWSKDDRILPSMASVASRSSGDIKDLRILNIQVTQGGEQTKLDKDDETLPSAACAAASIPTGSDERILGKDDGTVPSVAAVASISSGSDEKKLDKDDGGLPLVAAVSSISSGSVLTPLVTAAASILSSGSEWSKDVRILASMASVASMSSGSAIGPQFKDYTFENFVVKNLPVQVVQSSTPGNQRNKDDTIRDYLLKRMKTLCSKANQFTPATWNTRYEVDIAHMFTDLDLLKENKGEQIAKPTTLQEVLDIIKSSPACRVLMEGEGGIGKSTLLRFLAYNWANKLDETFKGKLVFLVNIRDIDKSVLDAIMKFIDLEDFEVKTDIEQGSKLIKRFIMSHDDEIVLLLDGLDELKDGKKSPIGLFRKEQFENSKVIITSRSEKIDEFIIKSDVRVNVKGYNERNIRNYITKYFAYCKKPALGDSLIKELNKRMKKKMFPDDDEVNSMCKNPMLLLRVCTIWEVEQYLPADKPDLFKEVFRCILNQYIDKDEAHGKEISIFEKTPPKYIHAMLVLGQCMYESLKRNKLSINKDDMEGEEQVVKLALKLGFVFKDASIYKDDFEEVFTPPHKLIVESLVGFYLSKLCFNDGFEHRINQLKPLETSEWDVIRINEYLEMARLFAIGFLGAEAGNFLKHWITNNVLTCRPLMTYLDQVNKENRIHVEKTIIDHFSASDFELKPHITDVCYSLRKVIHHIDPNVNANSNFMQLMIKVHDLGDNIIEHLKKSSEFIQMSPERLGKMMAYLFIAVKDQCYLLKDEVHLSNERVVKVLLDEFKKLCFQYDITSLPDNTCHPLLLSHILFNAPNITQIMLVDCSLTGGAMNVISNEYSSGVVLELKHLHISDNDLSAIEGASLASLLVMAPKLRIIEVGDCNLSVVAVNDMVRFCYSRGVVLELIDLHISGNDLSAIEGASLASLLVMAPKLESFGIRNCNLSGVAVNDMVRVCSSRGVVLKFRKLHIDGNDLSAIEGASLASLLVMAPKLESFGIRNCNLSGVAVNDMVRVCSSRGVVLKLRQLHIDGNDLSAIEGASLASLLVMAPKLWSFEISNCNLSGIAVNDMVRVCYSRGVVLELQILDIGGNDLSAIEDASLASLIGMAPKLSNLNMSNCRLSDVVMNDIIKLCSSRQILLS